MDELSKLQKMVIRIRDWPRSSWHNFRWDDYESVLNGRLTNTASLLPVVGYLVLLNDYVVENLSFEHLVGHELRTTFFLPAEARLKCIYFGSIGILLAHLWYLIRRPWSLRQGQTEEAYVRFGLENFTAGDFLQLHQRIQNEGHSTLHGKYYTDDWDAFWRDYTWEQSGRTDRMTEDQKSASRSHIHSIEAKRRHDDLLRSILLDRYIGNVRSRRASLVACLVLALGGYALFILPSVDLFLRVLEFTIRGQ